MLFSNFGLAVCAARWELFQNPLSESSVYKSTWPQVSPCETACRELFITIDAPFFHDRAAKLELWSLFQAQTSPKCTVRPRGTEDVASISAVAREHTCHFAILGGGTSPFKGASNAEDGITIDMSLLKTLELDSDSMQITVGGGSIWADVYRYLDPRNLSAAGTRNSLTGVAGLEALTIQMPSEIEMVATTLGWHVQTNQFAITERPVASDMPRLPRKMPVPSSMQPKEGVVSHVLDEHFYADTTLAMSQKMDRMNAAGFFNYFGSVTVKNNVRVFMAIADVFRGEVFTIKDALGLQVYIVYNPLTVSTIEKMSRRGGNALGIRPGDGPLTIVNINLHWSDQRDTERMRGFMRRLIHRMKHVAGSMEMLHPYIFQNHAFEEDDIFAGYGEENRVRLMRIRDAVDPDGVFARLQPGYYKL